MKFALATAFNPLEDYAELARTADECDWDAVTLSEHVVYPREIASPYPYTADGKPRFALDTGWPDPWVAIAAMAQATERIRFLTNIYVLPMRNPFHAAKAIATAAVLSEDRVSVGVGVGWMREEFELLEQDFSTRGKRTDEMIEILRKLWSGRVVEHRGDFYEFPPLNMLPAPRERIPIYIGGTSEAAFRRVGRLGDGWISELHTAAQIEEHVARIRQLRAEYGREKEPLEVFASCMESVDVDGYRRLEEAGVTHMLSVPWSFLSSTTIDLSEKKDGIRRFTDQVIAKLR